MSKIKPWNHPDNLMTVKAFRSKRDASNYRKFQGWTTTNVKIRMFYRPTHPWANKRGNVIALRIGKTTPVGWEFLFDHGAILPEGYHGLPKD